MSPWSDCKDCKEKCCESKVNSDRIFGEQRNRWRLLARFPSSIVQFVAKLSQWEINGPLGRPICALTPSGKCRLGIWVTVSKQAPIRGIDGGQISKLLDDYKFAAVLGSFPQTPALSKTRHVITNPPDVIVTQSVGRLTSERTPLLLNTRRDRPKGVCNWKIFSLLVILVGGVFIGVHLLMLECELEVSLKLFF